MRVIIRGFFILALLTIGTRAHAAPQTWVAGGASGTCTLASPCATFSAAIALTDAGGVVSVLRAGEFFGADTLPVQITKSLTIRAAGPDAGGTAPASVGAFLNVNVGPTDVVVLDGLHFVGPGLNISGSGTVLIRNCSFGFNSNAFNSANKIYGIRAQPTGALRIVISDSIVEANGVSEGAGTGAGIQIVPASGGTAQVMLERVTAQRNVFGIAVDGSLSTGGINVTINDSVLSANLNDGLVVTTSPGGAPIGVLVANSKSTNNGYGIRAIGNVTVRVSNSRIAGNGTGVSALNGGALLTTGNNIVQANATNGSFTGPVPVQ